MCDPFVSTVLIRHWRAAAGTAGFYASAGVALVRGANFRIIGFSGDRSPCELSLRGTCNGEREKAHLKLDKWNKERLKEAWPWFGHNLVHRGDFFSGAWGSLLIFLQSTNLVKLPPSLELYFRKFTLAKKKKKNTYVWELLSSSENTDLPLLVFLLFFLMEDFPCACSLQPLKGPGDPWAVKGALVTQALLPGPITHLWPPLVLRRETQSPKVQSNCCQHPG